MKKAICLIMVLALVLGSVFTVSVAAAQDNEFAYSEEYKTSPYYARLMEALEEHKDSTAMERTLAVALSQEGYKNYATDGIDVEQARADGKLWTGVELRVNDNLTGNTEYTRWAQRDVMGGGEESQYADYDWCAIFVSWCLYQAGYYDEAQLKKYYYAYVVDPRIFFDADSWIESFNLDQRLVYYPPKAHHKLDAMDWNTYYNVDVDPFDIPYKPGGLIFFSWDGSGKYYDHVGIVVDYDTQSHVLTYTNGNSDGQVITRQVDLDAEEAFRGQAYCLNADRILAYADYDTILPPEPKEITAETPSITWDKGASSGVKIKTDSGSVMASVYLDNSYYGSIIESNMVFHEGLLTIGRSELAGLSAGTHQLKLVFDDGEVTLPLKITDKANALLGDVDLDGAVELIDATWIQRYEIGLSHPDFYEAAADVDGDGDICIVDATWLQRYDLGMKAPAGIGMPLNG